MRQHPTRTRRGISLTASVQVDAQRLERMWRLSAAEREAAARRGEFSLGEMCQWAARHPDEVQILPGGDYWFMAPYMPEYAD